MGIAIDGDTLVSGSSDQTIKVWNLKELKNLKSPSIDYERLKQDVNKQKKKLVRNGKLKMLRSIWIMQVEVLNI